NLNRPVRAERQPCRRGTDRVVTDLRHPFRVRRNGRAELPGEHLRAQANAQKWTLLPKRDLDPVDFLSDVAVGIIGTHRAAENNRAGIGFASPPELKPYPSDR